MVSNLCDSCKSATATLFCHADSAFLCVNCDTNIHAANKLASLHARVWVCEVCEHAPAHVTCKAEAAALCVNCDRDIHSANPLARRHQRVPVTPFYDSVNSSGGKHKNVVVFNFLDDEDRYFNDVDRGDGDVSREEAEAALWLLPNQKVADFNTDQAEDPYVFSDLDPYLDLDYGHVDPKLEAKKQNSSGTDGVVPKETKNADGRNLVNDACIDLDFSGTKSYGYGYKYNNSHAQCLSQSVSPSSLDVGVVPDGGSATMDVTNPYGKGVGVVESRNQTVQISSADREARVSRYRERRKNRKFEKMIRYASRKAYAEMRPRIKGRFAKRTDIQLEAADRRRRSSSSIYGFSVVPSF